MNLNQFKKNALYFTAGTVPTEIEIEEAQQLSAAHRVNVRIRNGAVPLTGGLEKCDYVAGPAIPPAYSLAFPLIGEANETQATLSAPANTGDAGVTPEGAKGAQSSPSSLASEVGSITGGWGTPA